MSRPETTSSQNNSSRPFASMADRMHTGSVSFEARPEIKQQTFDEIYGVPENFLEIEVSWVFVTNGTFVLDYTWPTSCFRILTWWLYFPLFSKYRYETLKPTEQLEECIPTMKSFAGPISQPLNSRTRRFVEDTAISSVLGIYWNERLHASQSRHYLAKSLQTGSQTKLSSIAEKVWSAFCKCMCDMVYIYIFLVSS